MRFDRADFPEDAFDVRQLRRAESQKVGVPGWAMRNVEPQVKQQRPLQQELVGVVRDADPVKQALNGVAGEDQIEILFGLAGTVEQARTHRCRDAALVHDRLSM